MPLEELETCCNSFKSISISDNYNLFRDPVARDVERAEEQKQHARSLNPIRRTGRSVEQLGHSSLIKHFLGLQQIERQKNVSLSMPLTTNDASATPVEEFLRAMKEDNLKQHELVSRLEVLFVQFSFQVFLSFPDYMPNPRAHNITRAIRLVFDAAQKNLNEEKIAFQKMSDREFSRLEKRRRENDMERNKALRDAKAFSKSLLAEYVAFMRPCFLSVHYMSALLPPSTTFL